MTWDELTIPCPMQYMNHSLYYYGHLDADQIVSAHSESELEDDTAIAAAELAKKHQTLEETKNQVFTKSVGDKSVHRKDDTTPMEVEDSTQIPLQGETVPPTKEKYLVTGGITSQTLAHDDDSNIEMKDVNMDIHNVSGKGEED